jgi:acyl-CoA thioester hydrolase
VTQQLTLAGDGSLVAELRSVGGLIDLTARKLVPDPGSVWLRGATLEDVFLQLTGRGLLE